MSEFRGRIEAAFREMMQVGSGDGPNVLAEEMDREIGYSAMAEALESCELFFEDCYQRLMAGGKADAGIAAGTMLGVCRAALRVARGEQKEKKPCEYCVEGTIGETDWTGAVHDRPCTECNGTGQFDEIADDIRCDSCGGTGRKESKNAK